MVHFRIFALMVCIIDLKLNNAVQDKFAVTLGDLYENTQAQRSYNL